jgi:hypothetical protein
MPGMRSSPPLSIILLANFLAFGLVDHLYFAGRIGRIGYLYARITAEQVNSALSGHINRFFP